LLLLFFLFFLALLVLFGSLFFFLLLRDLSLLFMSKRIEQEQESEAPPNKKHKASTDEVPPLTEAKSSEEHADEAELLEQGHIHFFYRPKVETEEASSMADVKRLVLLLSPKEGQHRLLQVPKKHLPDIKSHERTWAFVSKVGPIDEVVSALGEEHYQTKTRGERTVPRARLLASGIYAIARHKEPTSKHRYGNHTHLAYVLELPHTVKELHKEFNIQHEGSFVMTIKNPSQPSTTFAGLGKKASFPEELQSLFGDYKFIPVNPPRFLDYPGAELIMVGAKADVGKELHEVGEQIEEEAEKEARKLSADALYKQLHLYRAKLPISPLKGKWA